MSKVPVNGIPSFLPPSTNLKFYRHENWYIIKLYNIINCKEVQGKANYQKLRYSLSKKSLSSSEFTDKIYFLTRT